MEKSLRDAALFLLYYSTAIESFARRRGKFIDRQGAVLLIKQRQRRGFRRGFICLANGIIKVCSAEVVRPGGSREDRDSIRILRHLCGNNRRASLPHSRKQVYIQAVAR